MPRHSRALKNTDLITDKMVYLLEIHDTCIIIVLSGEESLAELSRVGICKWMGVCVPATKAEVETTDTCTMIVYYHYLHG